MPAPKRLDPARSRAAKFGALLRELRLAKGWSQARLGREAAMSNSLISKIETGDYVPSRDTVRSLDSALDARGRLWKQRDELDDNPDSTRVRSFLTSQSHAEVTYHIGNYVPAMLETEEHTRIGLEAGLAYFGGQLEDKLVYRAEMRAILRRPDAPLFRCVLWESALHVKTGDTRIMREQLQHLIERSREPNVELRILPFAESIGCPDVGTVIIWEGPNDRVRAWRDTGNSFGTFISGRTEVSDLMYLYDHIRSRALQPDATRELISKAIEELYPCLAADLTCP
ncbi:hypothetical protein GCM10010218_12970 [Streptomyces mashuensis]|uniref:HTH cro/C1-type domain-containing protein n=1 Tax=Streptomyces mashuensis TaxID=33904 RepID=A0A919B105_9ACTN|nr:helix-turn-helix transcriptional regulator [Streptomyces mashuensis]GHF33282.1 hypothetical protein GCM10010218_12970 [Streptomyces mashuensis]